MSKKRDREDEERDVDMHGADENQTKQTTAEAAEKDEKVQEGSEVEREKREALQALRDLTSDDDMSGVDEHVKLSLSSILGGDILGGRWFRRQFWYIIMVVCMLIVYVSNRYACQQEMIQTKMLTDTLLDRRYKALTRSSQLKEKTRRSYIEESLADTTLQTPNNPSYVIKVDNE